MNWRKRGRIKKGRRNRKEKIGRKEEWKKEGIGGMKGV